jgi:hypothetical protein
MVEEKERKTDNSGRRGMKGRNEWKKRDEREK